MATPAGLEPAISALRGRRSNQLDGGAMVTRAGFEPCIAALKGLCPDQLDERAAMIYKREYRQFVL